MESEIDLAVLNADQLVCVGGGRRGPRCGKEQGELDCIVDGAMVTSQGRIVDVGPTADIRGRYDLARAEVVDARGRCVLPGLVDAHTHPLFAGLRSDEYAQRMGGASREEIAAAGGGIWNSVLNTRAATDEDLVEHLASAFTHMLAGGTTTIEAKSGYGQTVEEELRHLRLIDETAKKSGLRAAVTMLAPHLLPAEFSEPADFVDHVTEVMMPATKEQGIATFFDTICGPDFPPSLVERVLDRAAELDLRCRIHADGASEVGGWRLAAGHGLSSADHLTSTSREEIAKVGRTDTVATLIPLAELYYLWPKADARAFIENDAPVAIATDYCSSIPVTSLMAAMGVAAPWFRMTPEEVIVAATINPAYSLGLHHEVGSLEAGKRADFVVLGCSTYRDLIYQCGLVDIDGVFVGGRRVSAS